MNKFLLRELFELFSDCFLMTDSSLVTYVFVQWEEEKRNDSHGVICSSRIAGWVGGVNPLAHSVTPLALVNFNPLGGSPQPPPLAHITGNEWCASFYHTPTVKGVMHTMCVGILTSFGYEDKFQRLTIYKNTPFQDQKSKILEERGTIPSDRGIEESPLPTPHTARVPQFDQCDRLP